MDMAMIVSTLAVALGASFTSGINVYATVAVLGLLHRYVDSFTLPGDLGVLGSHWVIWPALAMYLVEFVADKVPAVDSTWDAIHTFIRVPAGAVIAAAAFADVPSEVQVCAAIIGGTLALGSHTTKATTRLAAHSTGTSPVASPILSIGEDIAVIGFVTLIATHPILSLFIFAILLIVCYYIIRSFWRLARGVFRALFGMGRRGGGDMTPARA